MSVPSGNSVDVMTYVTVMFAGVMSKTVMSFGSKPRNPGYGAKLLVAVLLSVDRVEIRAALKLRSKCARSTDPDANLDQQLPTIGLLLTKG